MAGDVDREALARYLLGDRLTADEADSLAAAMLPVSPQALLEESLPPFEVVEEGLLPNGTPYRIRAVGMQGRDVILGIDGQGGTSWNWWLRRPALEKLLAISDGSL